MTLPGSIFVRLEIAAPGQVILRRRFSSVRTGLDWRSTRCLCRHVFYFSTIVLVYLHWSALHRADARRIAIDRRAVRHHRRSGWRDFKFGTGLCAHDLLLRRAVIQSDRLADSHFPNRLDRRVHRRLRVCSSDPIQAQFPIGHLGLRRVWHNQIGRVTGIIPVFFVQVQCI